MARRFRLVASLVIAALAIPAAAETVTVITSFPKELTTAYQKAFEAKYPGDKLFDLDLIQIVRRSDQPIRAMVDNHYLTFYVLQKVFGTELARYSPTRRLMLVGPVTRHDIRHLRKENFVPDLRLIGRTELKLRMAKD